jgi:hypothetical protein
MRTLPPAVRSLRSWLALSLGLLAAACSPKKSEPAPKPSASVPPVASAPAPAAPKPEVLAQRFTDCQQTFNRGALDELVACYAPNAVSRWLDSGLPDETGPSAIVDNRKKSLKAAFPEAKIVPQLVLVNGNDLASTGVLSGVHTGPLMAASGVLSATKKAIGQLAFQTAVLDATGTILQESLLFDRGSMLAQLGLGNHAGRPKNTQGRVNGAQVITATGNATEHLNLGVVDKQWHALAAENLPAFAANLADDVVLADQTLPEDLRGKGLVVKAVDAWLRGLDKIELACPTLWAAGPYVVSVCRLKAVNDGDLGELKRSGRPVSLTIAEIARFEGGLEREIIRFSDSARLASEVEGDKAPGPSPQGAP